MNNARRKELARAIGLLNEAREIIATEAAEERDYYDAMPESIQNGERGSVADEAATSLEDAEGMLDDVITYVEQACA